MKLSYLGISAAVVIACDNDDLLPPLSKSNDCHADIALQAWAAADAEPDGSVEVSGSTRARDGITVRAIYVASTPVPQTDFNFRAWNVHVPSNRVAATVHGGKAYLRVTAFSSEGCSELPEPLVVNVEDAEGDGGSGGDGGEGGRGAVGGTGGEAARGGDSPIGGAGGESGGGAAGGDAPTGGMGPAGAGGA